MKPALRNFHFEALCSSAAATDFAETQMLGVGVEWTGTASRKCMSVFTFAGHIKLKSML